MRRSSQVRRGAVVLFVGPDGTGKSSVVTFLKEIYGGRIHYLWGRPALLPRRSAEGTGDASRPHDVVPEGRLRSLAKLVYLFLDFQLGWMVKIWPQKRRGAVIILERGWWDMAVDQRRYRMTLKPGIIELLGRFVPRPDLVLRFHGPPHVIRGRKPELSEQELARQIGRWRRVLPPSIDVVDVDVSGSFEGVSAFVRDAIDRLLEDPRGG